eukprot:9111435-Pyramimonas_sp.AAC.1
MYLPPQPRHARLVPHYKATVQLVAEWYDNILQCLPSRCTPLVYVDLNDWQGISRIAGQWHQMKSSSLGPG